MIVHEQILWSVIGIFYLLQHFKFLKRNEAYLYVSAKGSAMASIPALPFETIKGVLYIVNPFVPYRVLFRCHWGMADAHSHSASHATSRTTSHATSNSAIRHAWLQVCRTNQNLKDIRVVAVLAWVLFFVACPVLTWQVGLEKALWVAIPAWIFLYGAVAFLLLTHKFDDNRNVWLLLFECLVCPAYIAALPRMLQGTLTGPAELARLVKRYGTDAEWQRLKLILERRIEGEVLNDPSLESQLDAYRTEVLR